MPVDADGWRELPSHPRRSLPPPERTAAHLFARQVDQSPGRVLLRTAEADLTYEEVARRVAGVGSALGSWGARTGDRIVVISGNRAEVLEVFLACAFGDMLFVPLNPHLRGAQLEHQLSNAEPSVVLVEEALEGLTRRALAAVGADAGVVVLGPGNWATDTTSPRPASTPLVPACCPSHPLAVLYTSGTTGPSKGVLCPQGQFFWWAINMGEYLQLGEDDVLHTTLPLYHVNALTAFLQAGALGATFSLGTRFSASGFTEELRRSGATVTYLLGAMTTILSKQPPSPHDRDHQVRIALAPGTPPHLWDGFQERFGFDLLEGFGMTELNLVVCAPPHRQRGGTMGWAIDGFQIDVVDEEDHSLPPGTPGELVVRPREPHSIASGYWRDPDATVEAWRNLWFHTGDRVVRHRDGSVAFQDRIKDAIRRRGENISSFEVEAALTVHPSIEQAACFGVSSELGEEEVMVCILPRPGAEIHPPQILDWARDRLAYFAVPRYVRIVPELPRTPNGKIAKAQLRQEGVTDDTYDAGETGLTRRRP